MPIVRARLVLPALAFVLLATRLCAQSGFERILPAQTLMFVGIDSADGFVEDFERSASGRLWADPGMAGVREACAARLHELSLAIQEELGIDLLQLPPMLHGPVALAWLEGLDPEGLAAGRPEFSFALLADVGDDREACEELVARLFARAADEPDVFVAEQTVGGCAFRSISAPPASGPRMVLRAGFRESVLVVVLDVGTPTTDHARRLVAALAGPAPDPLADSASWRASVASRPGRGLRVWVDLARIVERLTAVATAHDAEQSGVWIRGLGLPDLRTFAVHTSLSQAGSRADVQLAWGGDGWIPRVLRRLLRPGGARLDRLVPGDVRSATFVHPDLGGLYDDVLRMIIEFGGATPAELAEGLVEMEETLGFDPRADLIDALGDELALVVAEVDPAEAVPGLSVEPLNAAVVVELDDAAAFSALVDDVLRRTGLHAVRKRGEFLGSEISNVTVFPPFAVNFAILDEFVVASLSPTMVREVLRRAHSEGDALDDQPAFVALRTELGADAEFGLLSWSDAAGDLNGAIETLRGLPAMFEGTGEPVPDVLTWLSLLPMPDAALVDRYFTGGSIATISVDAEGVMIRTISP